MDQIHLSNQSPQRLPIILALSLFIFFQLTFSQPIIARPGWIQTTLTIEIQAHIDGEDILINIISNMYFSQDFDDALVTAIDEEFVEFQIKFEQYLEDNFNIKVEVIDLRTIKPLDWNAIFKSVRKTGRLLVLDTGFTT